MKKRMEGWLPGGLLLAAMVLMNICRNFLWLLPSALMSPITEELTLTYAQAGSLSLTPTVLMGVFLIFGSMLLKGLGMTRAMVFGLMALMVDGLCSFFGRAYLVVLLGKIFCGIGYGLTTCAASALMAATFPKSRLGLANSINLCAGSLTITLAYALLVPIYRAAGSWHMESGLLAVFCLVTALLFLLWGKRFEPVPVEAPRGEKPAANALPTAMGYHLVRNLAVIMGSILLIYVSVNSYFPNYLHHEVGFSLERASTMTGVIPIAGMVGSLIMGVAVSRVRQPKLVFLALLSAFAVGFVLIMNLQSFGGILCAICVYGACYNAMNTIAITKIMQLPNIDPYAAGAGVSMMNAFGSLIALAVPTIQQALMVQVGMKWALFSFAAFLLPAFVMALIMEKEMSR